VLLYILIISVANLGVGFALAVLLGYGFPRRLQKPVDAPAAPPASPESITVSPTPQAVVLIAEVERAGDEQATFLLEEAIKRLQQQVDQYRDQLASLDDRMRHSANAAEDRAQFQTCLDDLKQINKQYLEGQAAAVAEWRKATPTAATASLEDRLGRAILQQNAQIQSSSTILNSLRDEPDLQLGYRRLSDESDALADAGAKMRDASEQVRRDMVEEPEEAEAAPASRKTKADAASLLLPAQLESQLRAWWESSGADSRALSMALIDIDGLTALNRVLGPAVGEKVVDAVGKVLATCLRESDLLARLEGSNYLLALPDTAAPAALDVLEQVREAIQHTQFRRGDNQIQVTIGCGLTESLRGEQVSSLISRCETALHDAKRAGRSQTFFNDGEICVSAAEPAVMHRLTSSCLRSFSTEKGLGSCR